ncbi:WPP domain-associated protein-like [Vicia villosa]|uniref:WPP domain-associated protein-like n=1 Tax=Vicia villosa TaxID=3911 RepID=UPI00273B417C|nr:WPP domain-associated protein-like [Vicia villosa]XP_058762783.1 WPP domain-associated protein-like [Vicia villosa]
MMDGFTAMNGGGERVSENGVLEEDESLGDHILEEMESFFLDIDERLIISRMVSDSVIKGVVNAVEEQAAERIAQKESEVVGLKKKLSRLGVGLDEAKRLWSSVRCSEPRDDVTHHCLDGVMEKNGTVKLVDRLRFELHEQLNQLKKEINKIRGPSSIRRFSSGSDLMGLGGILQESVPGRWIYVDKAFDSLKVTMDSFCTRIETMDRLSKAANTHSEWLEEQEFQLEIERMVIRNCIQSLQQEFEQKLCGICESESINSLNQFKEISSLREDLDSIFRTLAVYETGTLISHGSLEHTEDWCHNKRAEHIHLKLSTDHSPPSAVEENGKHEDSKSAKPDSLDSASLKSMSKDDLITYITKMRRNHESQVQEKTEENFCLRRELLNLKERGSSFSLKKDKDFDLLKKKIPDVVTKLNEILDGNEKLRQFSENIESLSSFKDRLDFLQTENSQLKDMLTEKKKEVKSLSSQLSVAMEKSSQQQLTEESLLRTVQKLEDDVGDAHAEVSIINDLYKCLFEDTESKCRFITEELHLKNGFMQETYEVILKDTVDSVQASYGLKIEEANIEAVKMQGLLDINQIIFKEALVDADEALKLKAAENKKLISEIHVLKSEVEGKENLVKEATDALEQEKRKMESASEQLDNLRAKADNQCKLIGENSKELDVTKGNLVAAEKEIEKYKKQIYELDQNLEQKMNELGEIDKEKRELCTVAEKLQDALKCYEAKERETTKQMELTVNLVHKLLKMVTDLEASVNEDISRNCSRLESMNSEFCFLKNKANALKTMGLVYKQKLETKSSNLANAEAEVDLLGDEVDTLLRLLERIYVALDHYSHILQHYPGIMEILKLVRKELTGDSRKLV